MDKLLANMVAAYKEMDRKMYDDPELWVDNVGDYMINCNGDHIIIHHAGKDLSSIAAKKHYKTAVKVAEALQFPKPTKPKETNIRRILVHVANAMGYKMDDLDYKTLKFSPISA